MIVTVAIDSFKGSIDSISAGKAAEEGIRRVYPDAKVYICPIADGGEGTIEALSLALGAEEKKIVVKDSLYRPCECKYSIAGRGTKKATAIIEMAVAAGLPQLEKHERNPLNTTTYGVGEIIKDAIGEGCRDFLIGIGGSSTNDGGTGMLSALGFKFLDINKKPIALGAKGLRDLVYIDDSEALPELSSCKIRVACDVNNSLCGEFGCSHVFARQKGADDKMISDMDNWLKNYARLTKEKYADADDNYAGSGAAGGLGFAFREYLSAELVSGIDLILSVSKIEDFIKKSDVVITGEGRLDAQSAMGKAPVGVSTLALRHNKLCLAFAGGVTEEAIKCNDVGIDAFFPIVRGVTTLEDAMEKETAARNLSNAVTQAFRLIRAAKN